jgi:aliphatic sulfonates family ABC transporter substrate-binding protein
MGNSRLAIGHNLNYFPIIIAYEKGFLKEEFGDALKIEIPYFANGPVQNEAFIAGKIDIVNAGDLPTIQLWANGTDIQVISYLWDAPGGHSLVANKRSGIRTLSDLKGKKITSEFGSSAYKLVLTFLASQGLGANDAELVHLKRPEALIALKRGVVDAAATDEPFISEALRDDNIVEITTSKDYGGVYCVAFVRTEFAQKNPQIVSRYLKVIKKANDWIARNVDEATRIVMKFMGSGDFEGTKKYLKDRIWPVAADQGLIDRLNDTIKFCRDQKLITRDDLDAKNLVNGAYIKEAGL